MLPFKCYYLHILPKNKEAQRLLDTLPDTMEIGDTLDYISIFHKLMRTEFPNPDVRMLSLSSGISQILCLSLRDSSVGAFQNSVISNKTAILSAEKYLRENYHRKISLHELSRIANISPVYFHKIFSAYFHKTPNAYLLDLRIAHAKMQLLEEDFSLADIALACGFTSQSYFCSRFKCVTGQTPLQYRRKELSKVDI